MEEEQKIEGQDFQEEINKILATAISIHEDEPSKIQAKGHTFKVKYPKRLVYDKIIKVGLKINKDGEVTKLRDKNADVRVCAYILLHNPILVFLFLRPYMFYLKWRYDGEVFCSIIEKGINPKEMEAFYKSSISIMSLSQSKTAMMQL